MATYGSAVAAGPRAGFWVRFAASLIDGLIVGLVSGVLQLALHATGDVLGLLAGIAYYVALEGGPRGAGLGKQAMGIRVVDQETAAPIGYGRALVRYLGRFISTVVFLLGYLWMLWDPERQCWHDKFARDIVVPTAVYPVGSRGGDPRY